MAKQQLKTKPRKQEAQEERDFDPLYVGEWIKATRKKQHELVKATGINQSYISNMSKGRRANPSAHLLRKIARFLGIRMDDLYSAPPPQEQLDSLRGLSEDARAALIDQPKQAAKG